jgi:imidazolonepropionase-like amidohydrolase
MLLLASILAAACSSIPDGATGHAYTNGHVFDGRAFVDRTFYVVDGRITFHAPGRVEGVSDLAGGYVIPPFGEAHNHNLVWSDETAFARLTQRYLQDGIFYVKNPTNLPRLRTPLAGRISIPRSVDAVFSNGALTASGGHPVEIVRPNRGFGESDGEGAFYFVIDTPSDLDGKWTAILAGKPDFIKIVLIESELYERRKDDPAFFGKRGLNPRLVKDIVRRAHAAGLRVTAHIETAADFHNAVLGGVDEMAHMPGFAAAGTDWSRYEIQDADAALAARRHVVVVTTLGELTDTLYAKDGSLLEAGRAIYELTGRNLQVLRRHGVTLAVGSDQYRQTSLPEALKLQRLHAIDNLALLKMWCEATAETIFPRRKIGHLAEGYEASFLVLRADPLADFANVQTITMRVKQGEVLAVVEATP